MSSRPRGASRAVRDAGSTTLELVVWAPGLLLIVALLAVAGRVNSASATLAGQRLQCVSTTVAVNTSGFAVRPGQPATVSATVTCPVRLSDLAIPGLPGTRTVTHTAVSSLDTFRERS